MDVVDEVEALSLAYHSEQYLLTALSLVDRDCMQYRTNDPGKHAAATEVRSSQTAIPLSDEFRYGVEYRRQAGYVSEGNWTFIVLTTIAAFQLMD